MSVARAREWLDEEILTQNRLIIDEEDDGSLVCFSDIRQGPEVVHLLMLASGGDLNLQFVDTETFENMVAPQEEDTFVGSADKVIVKWVQELISGAVEQHASDIHLEPLTDALQVRYRQDGRLRVVRSFGLEYRDEIVSRIKVLADLDIAEKRRPQDGKFQMNLRRRQIDFRVSCIPTGKGEKIVIRILDQSKLQLDIASLGMPTLVQDQFSEVINRPYGMLLVTGPTGSGKTTTLYSAMNEIKAETLNIMTIEDPIEYQIEGLNQTQVRPQVGFGFSDALRSFLRQDPNVIMVGEVRDLETAEMSIRAALTGHLVLSTLHTNTAVGAVPRLVDMGVEAYLLASALHLVLAQRLLRQLCPACKKPDPNASKMAERYKIELAPGETIYTAAGCDACTNKGYRGRLGVFECMMVDEAVREGIHEGYNETALAKVAPGYRSMVNHGLDLIRTHVTSFDELVQEVILGK